MIGEKDRAIDKLEYYKIKKLFINFLVLFILGFTETSTVSIIKNTYDVEVGVISFLAASILKIISLERLEGLIKVIHVFLVVSWPLFLILASLVYFNLRKYKAFSDEEARKNIFKEMKTKIMSVSEYDNLLKKIGIVTFMYVISFIALSSLDVSKGITSLFQETKINNLDFLNNSFLEEKFKLITNILSKKDKFDLNERLDCKEGTVPCNNNCWASCPEGYKFICPPRGNAYCEPEFTGWFNLDDFTSKVGLLICPSGENPNEVSRGTGFLVNKEGNVLTSYRLVKGAVDSHCIIGFTKDLKEPPSIFFSVYLTNVYDPDLDYALLYIEDQIYPQRKRITDRNFPFIKACNSDIAKLGDQILIVGYPFQRKDALTITTGIISGTDEPFLKTDVKIDEGNSGSPIILNNPNYDCFIGIATFMIKEVAEPLLHILPTNYLDKIYNF